MLNVPRWTVLEIALEARHEYPDPLHEVAVQATFTDPEGKPRQVDAFWDGEDTWRIRFSPDMLGTWSWRTLSNVADAGLSKQSGEFNCVAYEGDNPLYRHGPLRVAASRSYLEHRDSTPFFYLADTAWNGPLRSHPGDWQSYLEQRREQNFTAVQFVTTQWRAYQEKQAFSMNERLSIEPTFFQRLDPKLGAINQAHMVAVPVLLWSYGPTDPGLALPEGAAMMLARYLLARWGAYNVIWILAGDGDYRGERAERWKRIGREVFGRQHDRPVTMHPMGLHWVEPEFRDEQWYDFIGYQSSHSQSPQALQWLVDGPPARQWDVEPRRPVINLEPCYEFLNTGRKGRPNQAYDVRRATYRSLLVHPPAGVTYGADPVWVWNEVAAPALGHEDTHDLVQPWSDALDSPAAAQMSILAEIWAALPWTDLRPAPDMLTGHSEPVDAGRQPVAARSTDGRVAVVYLPTGEPVQLDLTSLNGKVGEIAWIDPHNGHLQAAEADFAEPMLELTPPEPAEIETLVGGADGASEQMPADWLLVLRCR